mmetsp:Transcript_33491/g.48990  ORF Transcript_33491/g.48990 Transcript_33491/m.48990 type:complete len:128 (+) Transcript_33491:61-444(+)
MGHVTQLRMQWSAPATPDEEREAADARQSVYKFRKDRIALLQAQAPLSSAKDLPPPSTAFASVSSSSSSSTAFSRDSNLSESGVTRLSILEAKVADLENAAKTAGKIEESFAKGFTAGYEAATRAMK